MRIPWGAGVVSDATKLKETCAGSDVYELIFLNASPAGFTDLTGWLETDSGTNINISNGVMTMNGNGTYTGNGIRWDSGLALAEGYLEFKKSIPASVALPLTAGINSTSALPSGGNGAGTWTSWIEALKSTTYQSNRTLNRLTVIQTSTEYTIRMYFLKSYFSATFWRYKVTIQGGIFTSETTLSELDSTDTVFPATIYPFFLRNTNNANLTTIKDVYWYSGLATDSPHVLYTADAGTGKTINGLDFTNLALPSGVSDTNLEFDYSFDDGTESWSSKYSLTALKALGSISGSKRYLRMRVYQNSNGETQTYGAIVNADDAIAGMGDEESVLPQAFYLDKSVVSVTAGTVITVTLKYLAATLMTGLTLKSVACTDRTVTGANTLTFVAPNLTAGIGNVIGSFTGYDNFTITNGIAAQAGASAPGAFVLTATAKARGNVLLKWTPSTGFDSYDVYVNGAIPTGYADLVVCEKLITLTADSSNEIYVKSKNGTGNTDSNTLTVATGKSASIVAGITNNLVQELKEVTIANGYTFTVNTVEQERMTERINGRLPMLEVCGPAVSIETKTTRGQQYTTGYSIIYRALINDDDLDADPATKQTEDIAADIIMALMNDYTHGGLAIMTTVTDYYHTLDEAANGTTMFNVIVTFEILTHVDMFNPYKIG